MRGNHENSKLTQGYTVLGLNDRACPATTNHSLQPITFIRPHVISPSPSPPPDLVPLGRTDLKVSALGIGTLQGGDPASGFGNQYSATDLGAAYSTLLEGGINFFDTAEVRSPIAPKKVNPSAVDFHATVPPRGRIV